MNQAPLRVLIVDDEVPARARLRDLLGDVASREPNTIAGMVANGVEALRLIEDQEVDVVLADIRMPKMNGVELAKRLGEMSHPPVVVFTTAYDQYAVKAFDLAATDYLLKPVRAERLAAALAKARALRPNENGAWAEPKHFTVTERGRILLVPVKAIRYLKAELKYVTAYTAEREYVLDETLVQIEEKYHDVFLRIRRNCLVAKNKVKGVVRVHSDDGEPHWEIILSDPEERLPISRRQWTMVREELKI